MKALLEGFADELHKHAGVLSAIAKHPFAALQAGAIGASTIPAAAAGFRKGMSGEKARYLGASKYGPSEGFYTNYHEALPHDVESGERRRMSYHYRPSAFEGNK